MLAHASGRSVPILPGATVLETLRENGIAQGRVGQSRDHGDLDGCHYFPGFHAEYSESKDAVALRVDQDFHEPARLGNRHRAENSGHRQLCESVWNAVRLGLGLAQADAGEFRIGEQAERHLASGRHAIAAGDVVAHDNEIIF